MGETLLGRDYVRTKKLGEVLLGIDYVRIERWGGITWHKLCDQE